MDHGEVSWLAQGYTAVKWEIHSLKSDLTATKACALFTLPSLEISLDVGSNTVFYKEPKTQKDYVT